MLGHVFCAIFISIIFFLSGRIQADSADVSYEAEGSVPPIKITYNELQETLQKSVELAKFYSKCDDIRIHGSLSGQGQTFEVSDFALRSSPEKLPKATMKFSASLWMSGENCSISSVFITLDDGSRTILVSGSSKIEVDLLVKQLSDLWSSVSTAIGGSNFRIFLLWPLLYSILGFSVGYFLSFVQTKSWILFGRGFLLLVCFAGFAFVPFDEIFAGFLVTPNHKLFLDNYEHQIVLISLFLAIFSILPVLARCFSPQKPK